MEALPKTYHHPLGPAAPFGIGCFIIGKSASRNFNRASNQFPRALNQRFIVAPPLRVHRRGGCVKSFGLTRVFFTPKGWDNIAQGKRTK
jgi:hypothetical protein